MVMTQKELKRVTMPKRPKKVKRIAVSSKRQISIPKEFYDHLNIGEEVTVELYGNQLILKPIRQTFDDFSEDILGDLIREGYQGEDLMVEFKHRKSQIGNAVEQLIAETKSLGEKTTIDDLSRSNRP